MCYTVFLSTDSPEDLAPRSTELVRFERIGPVAEDPIVGLLDFEHKWVVGSKSGCGCTFRHLLTVDLGFHGPEEWYPEEQDELEATGELFEVIRGLVADGHEVDCIDAWAGATIADIKTLTVRLDEVGRDAFRLFENHRFCFELGSRRRRR